MEQNFKAGDVVVLKSGGPSMTIESIGRYAGSLVDKAFCTWFDGSTKVSDVFTFESIKLDD